MFCVESTWISTSPFITSEPLHIWQKSTRQPPHTMKPLWGAQKLQQICLFSCQHTFQWGGATTPPNTPYNHVSVYKVHGLAARCNINVVQIFDWSFDKPITASCWGLWTDVGFNPWMGEYDQAPLPESWVGQIVWDNKIQILILIL